MSKKEAHKGMTELNDNRGVDYSLDQEESNKELDLQILVACAVLSS